MRKSSRRLWSRSLQACTVVLCAAALAPASCARRQRPIVSNSATPTNVIAKLMPPAAQQTNPTNAPVPALNDLEHASQEYSVSVDIQQKVLDALEYAGEPGMALAQLSNKLAGISTRDIMAVIVPLQRNRDYHDPQTRKIMNVYQVVLERGTPGWAVLFCTLQLSGFKMNSDTPEGYAEGLKMRREAKLSEHPSEMEKQTYASIQLSLEMNLRGNPPEQLKQIERIEQLQRDKVVEFPKQPLENLVLEKASCYYWLGRDDEARALIVGLYERYKKGELDPIMDCVFDKGLEHCIDFYKSIAKANREIADKRAQGKAFWED